MKKADVLNLVKLEDERKIVDNLDCIREENDTCVLTTIQNKEWKKTLTSLESKGVLKLNGNKVSLLWDTNKRKKTETNNEKNMEYVNFYVKAKELGLDDDDFIKLFCRKYNQVNISSIVDFVKLVSNYSSVELSTNRYSLLIDEFNKSNCKSVREFSRVKGLSNKEYHKLVVMKRNERKV